MTGISVEAYAAYEAGVLPLDYTEERVVAALQMAITAEGAGRRVVAEVQAAGWCPPGWGRWGLAPRDVDVSAVIAYEAGAPPASYAEGVVAGRVAITWRLKGAAVALGLDLGDAALARRVLGDLLDAGWQMPVWPAPEPGEGL